MLITRVTMRLSLRPRVGDNVRVTVMVRFSIKIGLLVRAMVTVGSRP